MDTGVALPELKIYELADKCPTINKLLKATNAGGSSEDASKLNITLEQLVCIVFSFKAKINEENYC